MANEYRIDGLAVEAFVANPSAVRIDGLAVEVWRTIASVTPRRRNAGMVI